jgi:hypothetical protein
MASEARVKNLQHVGKCDGDGNEEADFRLWVRAPRCFACF